MCVCICVNQYVILIVTWHGSKLKRQNLLDICWEQYSAKSREFAECIPDVCPWEFFLFRVLGRGEKRGLPGLFSEHDLKTTYWQSIQYVLGMDLGYAHKKLCLRHEWSEDEQARQSRQGALAVTMNDIQHFRKSF